MTTRTMMNRTRDAVRRTRIAARRQWARLPGGVRRLTPFAVVLLIGLIIGSTLFSRTAVQHGTGEEGLRAALGEDDGGDGLIWTCSMHPQIRQPGPGSCPICGMALIPIATGDDDALHGELPRLTVSERSAALMAVQIWPAERLDVAGDVRLSGTIGYDETLVHDIFVRTEGRVERLYVNYENAAVGAGQRIADIFSPAIQAASQELLQAGRAAQRGGMPELVEAAASQLLALGVSRGQIDRILETGEPARTYTVFSPAAGVVSDLATRQGEWLMAGGRLMRVAGLGRVWVQFEAYERDLGRLQVGRPLHFTVEAFPGQTFAGTIAFIDPVVDGGRRTARVRVQVDNPGGRLMPGMLARGQATVGATSADAPLVIPATAPLLTGRRAVVYVQLPGFASPTFEPRDVTLGERRGAYWEVTAGLTEGELVVVNGAFRIDSELQIRGRPSMMGAPAPVGAPAPDAGRAPRLDDSGRVPLVLSTAAGRELARVVDAYIDMTAAMSRDDVAAARTAARAFDAALQAASLAGLAAPAAGEWSRIRADLRRHATAMARSPDMTLLRGELLTVSRHMEGVVTSFHSDQVGPLYRAVCPMVNGREGSWLTRTQVVENPYYGAAMFDCGEVQGRVAG
jgi:membrane fusion protein, copper/silver efflux system